MIEKHIKTNSPASVVFDPIPSYRGTWLFQVINLYKNADKVDGKNLWDEFYKETYQKPLYDIFGIDVVLKMPVGMISLPNKDNIGRCLQFNKVDFFLSVAESFLNQNIDNYKLNENEAKKRMDELKNLVISKSNDELNTLFLELFKDKAEKIKDIINKGFNSEYFEDAMKDATHFNMDFNEYLKRLYERVTKMQSGFLKLGDFFDRNIDFNKLYECFDSDKFFLLFAKIIYEYNLIYENLTKHLDNSCEYLIHYRMYLERIVGEDKKYNPFIYFTLPNGKNIKYSRWNFMEELNTLLERHPESKVYKLPNLDLEDDVYKNIDLVEKMASLYDSDTKLNWEFLPKGEGIKKGSSKNSETKSTNIEDKDKDKLRNEVRMRIEKLEASGYIGTPIRGLNKFNGYYAFIYPSGVVILEKFWENESTLNPATKCATYVMNIDNFVEMSKVAKIDLVNYMKTVSESGVRRFYHTSIESWERNLDAEINGKYRLDDAIKFFNGLRTDEVRNDK